MWKIVKHNECSYKTVLLNDLNYFLSSYVDKLCNIGKVSIKLKESIANTLKKIKFNICSSFFNNNGKTYDIC